MDFLSFKSFISIEVLIVFYYMGAVVLPFVVWSLPRKLITKYNILNFIGKTDKSYIMILSIVMFIFMEILWRMMFEFLIAYMQIRDALV